MEIKGMKKLFAFLIFAAVVAAVYANCVKNEFVFDDKPLIVRNETIRDPSNLLGLINYDDSRGMSYRPVRFISFVIDYAISGDNPVGYHISNMIYHALSGYVLFLVLSFMLTSVPWLRTGDGTESGFFNAYTASLISALVFLTHPVQVDSVAYISGRRDILCTLFFLLAFYSYLKYRYLGKKWHLALVPVFYVLAVSAKEMAITLPAIIIMFEIIEGMKSDNSSAAGNLWKSAKSVLNRYKAILIPLVILAGFFVWYSVVYREASHSISRQGYDVTINWHGGSILINFLTVAKIWMTYLRLIFIPVKLSADYSSYPLSTSPFELATLLSVAGVALLVYATLKLLERNRAIGFGLSWYIVTLLPVSHIIPHHELMAEHYLYLPIIGFMIILSVLLLKANSVKGAAKPVAAVAGVVIVLYCARVVVRNRDWKTETILWKKTVETDPKSHRAWFNLGNIHREEFLFESALYYYDMAVKVADNDKLKAKSLNSVGSIYLKQKNIKKALELFLAALDLNPDYPATINNIAALYLEINELDKAEKYVELAVEKLPDFLEAKINQTILQYKRGEKERAKETLEKLLDENPGNLSVLNILAKVALEEGRDEDAKRYYEDILLFNNDNPDPHFKLGNLYFKENFLDLAKDEFMQAVRLNPGFYEAHLNLGNIYAQKNDVKNAFIFFENAVKIRPKSSEPHLGMALVYLTELKDFRRAKESFEKCLELNPNQPGARDIDIKIQELDAFLKKGG